MWESRVLQRAFERLELHEGKLSRAVLRGGGGGDVTSLPDTWVGNHPGLPGPEFPRHRNSLLTPEFPRSRRLRFPPKELAGIVFLLNSATASQTSWKRARSCGRKTPSWCQRRGSQSSRESICGTPRNHSAGHWNSAPSQLRFSSSCCAKARNSPCPGPEFVAETWRDNVVNYVCRDRAEGLWQYIYEKQARVSPTPNGGARACAR